MSEDDLETDEEDDVQVLGGEGFSAEDIEAAEKRFEAQLVSTKSHSLLPHQQNVEAAWSGLSREHCSCTKGAWGPAGLAQSGPGRHALYHSAL